MENVPLEDETVPDYWNVEMVSEALMLNARLVQRIVARVRPKGYGNSMPDVLVEFADAVGRVEAGLPVKDAERSLGATAAQVTAMEHIIRWQALYLHDAPAGVRRVLKVWIRCRATRRSFSKEYRARGWSRMTAYRRLDEAFSTIAKGLNRESVPTKMLKDLR